MGLSGYLIYIGNEYQDLISMKYMSVPIVFLVLGIAIVIIGFFGCFGALRESPCLLNSYAVIVMVLLLGQIALVIYGTVQKTALLDGIEKFMIKEVFDKYYSDKDTKKAVDLVQHEVKCCGVHNYTDWTTTIKPYNGTPPSCYYNSTNGTVEYYKQGCFTKIDNIVEGQGMWMIIAAVVLAVVQLGCVVIACGISRHSHHHV